MRRAVRLELIRLLLANEDRPRALGELVAAAADSANDVASAVELGRLFLQAGDDRRAADQFGRALRLDARDTAALDGAGIAAFHLARYRDARRYLAAADSRDAEARELRELADLVLQYDPLAPGVGAAERQRRLLAALQAVRQHLDACASTDAWRALVQEVDASSASVRRARRADPDALVAGVDLVGRAEQAAGSCGTPSPLDRALALVARLHGADR
jgi:tetratricopeptide (TPR) repeat protein